VSDQVNWEIQALDQTAGFLRDDPVGVAALWNTVSRLVGESRLAVTALSGSGSGPYFVMVTVPAPGCGLWRVSNWFVL